MASQSVQPPHFTALLGDIASYIRPGNALDFVVDVLTPKYPAVRPSLLRELIVTAQQVRLELVEAARKEAE